jgi:hypothetical protein
VSAAELLSWIAAGLVLASMSVTDFRTCRRVALASNIAFAAYGLAEGAAAILALHTILLVVNAVRLTQMRNADLRRAAP